MDKGQFSLGVGFFGLGLSMTIAGLWAYLYRLILGTSVYVSSNTTFTYESILVLGVVFLFGGAVLIGDGLSN